VLDTHSEKYTYAYDLPK